MRVEFDKKTKLAMFRRASSPNPKYPDRKPGRVYCEHCNMDVTGKSFHYDHKLAEWNRTATPPREREKLTAGDGWLLCMPCHHAKTGEDMKDKPRNDAVLAKRARAGKPKRSWPGAETWVKPVGGGAPRRRTK